MSPRPGQPKAILTVKKSPSEENESYIDVSPWNATWGPSIGDTVNEVSDSGMLGTTTSHDGG
jgi:hypothetical protein